jgi:low affinity Fe/Cu permease
MKNTIDRAFTRFSSAVARIAGQPLTFVLMIAVVAIWAVTGPMFGFSETWQLVINTGTTIVTFLMVFLIQNEQNRDTASMQAKLDELLHAVEGARNGFIGIEHLTSAEVEKLRADLEREVGVGDAEKRRAANASLIGLAKGL